MENGSNGAVEPKPVVDFFTQMQQEINSKNSGEKQTSATEKKHEGSTPKTRAKKDEKSEGQMIRIDSGTYAKLKMTKMLFEQETGRKLTMSKFLEELMGSGVPVLSSKVDKLLKGV